MGMRREHLSDWLSRGPESPRRVRADHLERAKEELALGNDGTVFWALGHLNIGTFRFGFPLRHRPASRGYLGLPVFHALERARPAIIALKRDGHTVAPVPVRRSALATLLVERFRPADDWHVVGYDDELAVPEFVEVGHAIR